MPQTRKTFVHNTFPESLVENRIVVAISFQNILLMPKKMQQGCIQ